MQRSSFAVATVLIAVFAVDILTTQPPAGPGLARNVARDAGLAVSINGDGSPGVLFHVVEATAALFHKPGYQSTMARCAPLSITPALASSDVTWAPQERCTIMVDEQCAEDVLSCIAPPAAAPPISAKLSRDLVELHELGHALDAGRSTIDTEEFADAFAALGLLEHAADYGGRAVVERVLRDLADLRDDWSASTHQTGPAIRAALAAELAEQGWRAWARGAEKIAREN